MRISQMVLEGYKPLLLNNINKFTYTPESPYQIIIGTNGSGKSSIMVELTPMPAIKADYVAGGSKTITLEHRGSSYILKNSFNSSSGHHSFIKDGEELNDGGTGVVQKMLVQKHFGLDQSLKDILTDQVTFTAMGPQQRREWITRLSGGDLDYAIRVYNQIKTRARDISGAIKHLKNRLVVESEKLTPKEKIDEMSAQAEKLKAELTLLMENKEVGIETPHVLGQRLEAELHELNVLSGKVLRIPVDPPAQLVGGLYAQSKEDVFEILHNLKSDLAVSQQMLKRTQEDYAELGDVMEALEKTGASGVDDLKKRIEKMSQERDSISQTIVQYTVMDEPDLALNASRQVHDPFQRLFSAMPDNSNGRYSRDRIDQAKRKIDELRDRSDKLRSFQSRLMEKKEHIKNAEETRCPSCGYVWIPGVSEHDLVKIEAKLEKIAEELPKVTEDLKRCETYIEAATEYTELLRAFKRMTNDYPRLAPLWDHILEQKAHLTAPAQQIHLMDLWISDLEKCSHIVRLDMKIRELQQAVDHLENMAQGGTHYGERLEKLSRDMELYTSRCQELSELIDGYTEYERRINALSNSHKELQGMESLLEKTVDLLIKSIKNQYLDQAINEHQVSLAMVQNDIIKSDSALKIVEDIQTQHDELIRQGDALKILMDELSPQDGFIAEQLMGFINNLVEEVNNIVGGVWTHDIEVLPCGIDSDELDYKFPLAVRGNELRTPDISKGSTSQREIIDFAFKMIVMLYLDLQDYPLYLDELAHSLDEQHRINIMRFVHQLVETGRCSQMFLISHYQTGHGQFTTAEYCVTDPANITTPDRYNEHVLME